MAKINSQKKGAAGEREFINRVNAQLGLDLERNPYRQQKEAGHYDVVGLDWLAIEVKRYQTASDAQVYNWWVEACSQADIDQVPVLAYRADRQDWHVVVPLLFVTDGFSGWCCRPDAHEYDLLGANLTILGFCGLIQPQLVSNDVKDLLT